MDRATQVQFLISGRDVSGNVRLSRDTAVAALKKARELLQEGYLDVRICTPRGRILSPGEFEELDR